MAEKIQEFRIFNNKMAQTPKGSTKNEWISYKLGLTILKKMDKWIKMGSNGAPLSRATLPYSTRVPAGPGNCLPGLYRLETSGGCEMIWGLGWLGYKEYNHQLGYVHK